jgi:nitroreductase
MPELLKIIKERRSIRQYQTKEISAETIDLLKQALIWAPSAGNLQARKFYFVFNQEVKSQLARTDGRERDFIAQAPLVIVGCVDEEKIARYGERGRNLFAINDVTLSMANAMLLAFEQGLGSCWVGAFDEGVVRKILKLPKHLRPIVILPLGYPAEKQEVKPRININQAIEEIG